MTKTLVATPDPEPEDPFPDLYFGHNIVEGVGEPLVEPAVEVLNVPFMPNPIYGGVTAVLRGKDADGWALVRIVPFTEHEAVAVFERWT